MHVAKVLKVVSSLGMHCVLMADSHSQPFCRGVVGGVDGGVVGGNVGGVVGDAGLGVGVGDGVGSAPARWRIKRESSPRNKPTLNPTSASANVMKQI
jgi:hypothetical protein